jgi:hypothetical protein
VADKWEVIAFQSDEDLMQFLREEGIPEEELANELIKLKKNAETSVQARAILITPEVDKILRKYFAMEDVTNEELDRAKEALWPRSALK